MKPPFGFPTALWCSFLCSCAFEQSIAAVNPPKLAGVARLDLNGAPVVGALRDGWMITGSGSVDRQTWLPTNEQSLTYTLHMPIVRFDWTEFAFEFVPEKSGPVYLSFRGPWEEATPGTGIIYKQEVLWDALQTTGASVANGSFESVSNGRIVNWNGGVSQPADVTVDAVEGSRMARTWHDDSMGRNLDVAGGVPVTIRFFARSVIPAGFADMKPIRDRNTPAHRTARRFMRGVNFGNSLEIDPKLPGRLTYTEEDFNRARVEGFDHVRLPVAWQFYAGSAPEFELEGAIFDRVDQMVAWALKHGLGIMIDVHHFEEFFRDLHGHTNMLYGMWRQIAAHYATAPESVVFEILNEPRDPVTTAEMNPIFAEAIRQIRASNPDRTLFVGPSAFNGISELHNLLLPDNDSNLIATVHTYDPFFFTHQGLEWAGEEAAALPGIAFPGPPSEPLKPNGELTEWAAVWLRNYNMRPAEQNPSSPLAFRQRLRSLRQWSDYYGRPVHVGEFGASHRIDAQSRLNYYRTKRQALDEYGLGWAIWDWKAEFHYWDNGGPDPPGLREALFPSPELRAIGPGAFEFDSAIGKRFQVERAMGIVPAVWEPVTIIQLESPTGRFADPEVGTAAVGFYRVRWLK